MRRNARGSSNRCRPQLRARTNFAERRQLRERAAAGERKSLLAKEFGVSRETVYAYLRTASTADVTS